MPVTFAVSTASPTQVKTDLLVIPVYSDRVLGPGGDEVDADLDGGLVAFMEQAAFDGKEGEKLVVPTGGALGASSVVLIGLGKREEVTADGLRKAGAVAAKAAHKARSASTTLASAGPADLDMAEAAQAVVEGVLLGGYEYLEYKSDPKPSKLKRVSLLGRSGALRRGMDRGTSVGTAVIWARDIVNTPARDLSPAEFARAAQRLLRGKGVKVEVLDVPALKRERLGGVIGVGMGSEQPPRLVKMTYAPTKSNATLALVGKGVIFDSGGLSLKPAGGMETMKTDMAGAAAVIAAMSVLADLGVKTKVIAFTPMVENMPSGSAIRPGDVLTFRNGKTAEVLNTDAEGRLILADALALAAEAKPDAIIDLATLTGACMVALGDKIAGLMTNDDSWGAQVRTAADTVGEPVWPLPLPKEYKKFIDSDIADIRNTSTSNYGGAITAGLFLEEFVGDVPWVHLDIAGPSRVSSDDGYTRRGASGFGVRTLAELASRFRVPSRK